MCLEMTPPSAPSIMNLHFKHDPNYKVKGSEKIVQHFDAKASNSCPVYHKTDALKA